MKNTSFKIKVQTVALSFLLPLLILPHAAIGAQSCDTDSLLVCPGPMCAGAVFLCQAQREHELDLERDQRIEEKRKAQGLDDSKYDQQDDFHAQFMNKNTSSNLQPIKINRTRDEQIAHEKAVKAVNDLVNEMYYQCSKRQLSYCAAPPSAYKQVSR